MYQTCEPGQERPLRKDGFSLVTRVIELFPFAIIFEAVIFYKGDVYKFKTVSAVSQLSANLR